MATRGTGRAARLRPSELKRLNPLLAGGAGGALELSVAFRQGVEGFPEIQLRIAGAIGLACQRCLGRLDWPLDVDVVLTVVGSEEEATRLASPYDSVVLEGDDLQLLAVVEDEILAVLPLAPMHPETVQCAPPGNRRSPVEETARSPNRPFAGLGELIGRGTKD